MSQDNHQAEGFFYQPHVIRWILRVFYAICVVLLLLDFVVHRHIVTDIEKIPTFYGVYGLVSCVILVWLAAQLRKVLMRDEDFYTKHEEDICATKPVNKEAADIPVADNKAVEHD